MKFILFSSLSIFFFQISLSQNFSSWNYQAECLDVSASNSTKIKVTNFDQKSKTDINLEKKMALHAILFKGIAGANNCISQPPLIKKEDLKINKRYFKILFGKKAYYNKYIISVEEIEHSGLDENNFKQSDKHSAIVVVDKDLLRKDLINDKIIKSLTNGF